MKPVVETKLRVTKSTGSLVITSIVLTAALFVILSKLYDDSAQKWAFGTVGLIVGAWLKR